MIHIKKIVIIYILVYCTFPTYSFALSIEKISHYLVNLSKIQEGKLSPNSKLLCSKKQTQQSDLNDLSIKLFQKLGSSCSIYDFTLPDDITRSFKFDYHEPITLDQLEKLAGEFTWGRR